MIINNKIIIHSYSSLFYLFIGNHDSNNHSLHGSADASGGLRDMEKCPRTGQIN